VLYRYESEVLLRVTQRIALFLSCLLGPTATPTVNYYEEVEKIEKVRARAGCCVPPHGCTSPNPMLERS
jgi:hypothetical protein